MFAESTGPDCQHPTLPSGQPEGSHVWTILRAGGRGEAAAGGLPVLHVRIHGPLALEMIGPFQIKFRANAMQPLRPV